MSNKKQEPVFSEGAEATVGAPCFMRSPVHSWVLATVESLDGKDTYTCKTRMTDGTHGVEAETLSKLRNDDIFVITNLGLLDENPDDLLMLTLLHDSTLMHTLNQRYFKDVIYTNIGAICVAFNPFKFTIPWYKDDVMGQYLEEDYPIRKNKPHSWAVAHNTYYELIDRKQDQCILVSGESGAGKTEAVKIVMKYLSAISVKFSPPASQQQTAGVGKKLLQASPILEGFGNAKTVRNDNSSRFGKFMKVQFSGGTLVGAFTIKYLLEKSRIVTCGPGERCYHSFYYICASKDYSKYKVFNNASQYKGLNAGKCISVEGVDDGADFNEVLEAFKDVGVTDEEKEEIWKTVGGVLNLLNVEFKSAHGGDGSEIDSSSLPLVQSACELWGIEFDRLKVELIETTREIKGEMVTKRHTPTIAIDTRDSLVKAVYDELFDSMVQKLNAQASVDTFSNFIGLLDIFGFEDFKVNSFEQICINLANETLQHHYNTYIFNKDIEECKAEGVDTTVIQFPDNTPCLKLITDKLGIIALLDEECALGKGSDMGFLDKVVQEHGSHPFFFKDRLKQTSFVVKHYAADVSYEVANFLDKNRDTLKDEMKILMRKSKSFYISKLLPEPVDKMGKKITVGGFFKNQLGDLMELINSTNPHWIRCIKPHPAKKPQKWHGVNVFTQLSSSGIIGTVKVRKAGFPIRMYHNDFLKRFRILKPGPVTDKREKCREIIANQKLDGKRIQVGTTRVFMKNEEYWKLEKAISEVAGVYVLVQQAYARHMYAKIVLGEKDFERNKVQILAAYRATMMIQINEKTARKEIEKAFTIEAVEKALPIIDQIESASRKHIEEEWENQLKVLNEREGQKLRDIQAYLKEQKRLLHIRQKEEREKFLKREENEKNEILIMENELWEKIMKQASDEQYARDKCREDEKRSRTGIDSGEAEEWVDIIEQERESYKKWKDRENNRLASEWKSIMENVYAVQAERKAASVAQEKYRADNKRREMAEKRRQMYVSDSIPKGNEEREALSPNQKARRDQAHQKRESEADTQVEQLRSRKDLLMGHEAARAARITRLKAEQAVLDHQKRHQTTPDGNKHDALASRSYPSDRIPLYTHANKPPQYLFSQQNRTTAEEIMAARSPTPGQSPAAHSSAASSPAFGRRSPYSPATNEFGLEVEPLFSPVRTRAAAGLDAGGNAISPMLPQPNPVSPPKLGSWN